MDELTLLRQVLHEEIPLTRTMGLQVLAYDGDSLELGAPLTPNTNHKNTAFGGSLYSMAVLTGWGLLYLKLKQLDLFAHIVIQQSEMDYLRPVTGDIKTRCSFQSPQQVDLLVKTFGKRQRARIQLETLIKQDEDDAVLFRGRYVIHN
jgi:thioesterase domain-containing protein